MRRGELVATFVAGDGVLRRGELVAKYVAGDGVLRRVELVLGRETAPAGKGGGRILHSKSDSEHQPVKVGSSITAVGGAGVIAGAAVVAGATVVAAAAVVVVANTL